MDSSAGSAAGVSCRFSKAERVFSAVVNADISLGGASCFLRDCKMTSVNGGGAKNGGCEAIEI